jgi:DNA-directed RNA polymerase subunit RPC12/RpoP
LEARLNERAELGHCTCGKPVVTFADSANRTVPLDARDPNERCPRCGRKPLHIEVTFDDLLSHPNAEK